MEAEFDIRKYKRHLKYQRVVRRAPLTLADVVRAWKPLRGLLLIVLVVLLIVVLDKMSHAADSESPSASLPDAPSAVMLKALPQALPPARRDENWLARAIESKQAYHGSQLFLIGATAFDAVQTWRALTHPTHLTGSYYLPYAGLWIYPNVDLTKQFSERGWARFLGPRNAGGVVAANVAVSAGVLLLSHELAKKGPRWRAVATALNSGRGAGSLAGALTWNADFSYANNLPKKWGYPVQTLEWKP